MIGEYDQKLPALWWRQVTAPVRNNCPGGAGEDASCMLRTADRALCARQLWGWKKGSSVVMLCTKTWEFGALSVLKTYFSLYGHFGALLLRLDKMILRPDSMQTMTDMDLCAAGKNLNELRVMLTFNKSMQTLCSRCLFLLGWWLNSSKKSWKAKTLSFF